MSPNLPLAADERDEHLRAVRPPPPSHPDDGPSVLDVPRLGALPASLKPQSEPGEGPMSLTSWLAMVALFLLGTLITYLVER